MFCQVSPIIKLEHSNAMNLANTITLARLPLLIVIILLFYFGDATLQLLAVPLVLLLIAMDAIDGIVARQRDATGRAHRLHERSRFLREQGRWYYVDGKLI